MTIIRTTSANKVGILLLNKPFFIMRYGPVVIGMVIVGVALIEAVFVN